VSVATTKHVVVGAGPLGRATAKALVHPDRHVILVNRSGQIVELPDDVDSVAGDLAVPTALAPIVNGAQSIYFCAQPPYHRWPALFPPLQEAVIALASGAGARLIVGENLYGYGLVDRPMTEDMPLRPTTRKGQTRAAMHQRLMEAHHAGIVRVAVARGSDFFGPFVEGSTVGARAFKAVVASKAVEYTGDADAPHSYTFVNDFGSALAVLGTDDRALGEVWHVPNAVTVSTRSFFELAFELASHPAKFRKVSNWELRLLGLFIAPLREMIEMTYEFEAPFIVDHEKFVRVFGHIATPLESALSQTIAWTRDQQSR
jgi:nucleoside-diphosphate-sugar epimerase